MKNPPAYNKNSAIPVFLLASLVIVIFTQVIFLFTRGMFFDGVIYGAISRNMAEGKGSFWDPFFSRHGFMGHPALVFWMESFFFRVFGDHFWTEKLFSFTTFLVTAAILLIYGGKKAGPAALLVFVSIPLVSWTYRNNLLDNVLSLFTLLSVALMHDYLRKGWRALPVLILSALCIGAGMLSKGPVALFPLVFPVSYALIYRTLKTHVIAAMVIPAAVLAGCGWLLSFHPPAVHFFRNYFDAQLVQSVTAHSELNRIKPLIYLSGQVVIPMGIIAVFMLVKRIWTSPPKKAFLWGLTALSAILPLMLSTKQALFYLVASLPFVALFAGSWLENVAEKGRPVIWLKNLIRPAFLILSLAGIGGMIYAFTQYGNVSRDRKYIELGRSLETYSGKTELLVLHPAYYADWNLHAYLQRFGKWEYDMTGNPGPHTLALVPPDVAADDAFVQLLRENGFSEKDTLTGLYHLYAR